MFALQRQVAKQAVLGPDPQIQGHESERPPSASRRAVSVRDCKVSRLSFSFSESSSSWMAPPLLKLYTEQTGVRNASPPGVSIPGARPPCLSSGEAGDRLNPAPVACRLRASSSSKPS
jgi:hypothetical protein